MICEWYKGHGHLPTPLDVLPKFGVVVENFGDPVAALWLYMDNSVGVCFAEKMVTAPGLSLGLASKALMCGFEYLRERAAAMDRKYIVVHAYAATARFLRKMNMTECEKSMSCFWGYTSPRAVENG